MHVFFRGISGDIFSKERMCRFGMVDNNTCERRERVEASKHLLWHCRELRNIWRLYNDWIANDARASKSVFEYEDIFWVDDNAHVCKLKVQIMQEKIQIIKQGHGIRKGLEILVNQLNQ